MSAFKRVNNSDVIVSPYVANKQWSFTPCLLSGSNIQIYNGQKFTGSFNPLTDYITNGQYDRLVFDGINHIYYQQFSGSYLNNTANLNSNNYLSSSIYRPSGAYASPGCLDLTIKNFPTSSNAQIKVIGIPKSLYSTKINQLSFSLSSSNYNIVDDGNFNLIDINSGSYVGNIFYSDGIIVITNPNYQSILPLPPFAVNDYFQLNYSGSKKLSILINDDPRGGILDTGSIVLSGSQASYFTVNGDGTINLNTSSSGEYMVYYTVNSIYPSMSCELTSNKALVDVVLLPQGVSPTTTTTTTTTTTAPPATVGFYYENYDNYTNSSDLSGYYLGGDLILDITNAYFSYNFFTNPGFGSHGSGQFQLVTGSMSKAAGSTLNVQVNYISGSTNVWGTATSASIMLDVTKDGTSIYSISQTIYPSSTSTGVSQNISISGSSVYVIHGYLTGLGFPAPTTTTTTTSTTTAAPTTTTSTTTTTTSTTTSTTTTTTSTTTFSLTPFTAFYGTSGPSGGTTACFYSLQNGLDGHNVTIYGHGTSELEPFTYYYNADGTPYTFVPENYYADPTSTIYGHFITATGGNSEFIQDGLCSV